MVSLIATKYFFNQPFLLRNTLDPIRSFVYSILTIRFSASENSSDE